MKDVIVPDGSNLLHTAQNMEPATEARPEDKPEPRWKRWIDEEGDWDPPKPGERPMGMDLNVEYFVQDVLNSDAIKSFVAQIVGKITAEEADYVEGIVRSHKMDTDDRDVLLDTLQYNRDHRASTQEEMVEHALKAMEKAIVHDLYDKET